MMLEARADVSSKEAKKPMTGWPKGLERFIQLVGRSYTFIMLIV